MKARPSLRRAPSALLLSACAVLSCGRSGFEMVDVQLGRSAADQTFGEPRPIAALVHPGQDEDPSATGDLLELYFTSMREGGPGLGDIWVSTRSAVDQPWGAPQLVVELSSAEREGVPVVSPDGLMLRLARNIPNIASGWDIFEATRPRRDAPWSAPVPLTELNTDDDELPGSAVESGLLMALHSNRAGLSDLFVTTRPDRGAAWGAVAPLDEINTPAWEASAHLNATGTRLLFAAEWAGGAGGRDLYVATRSSAAVPFDAAQAVPELNTDSDDQDGWLSEDGRTCIFASDRSGDMEIYAATR